MDNFVDIASPMSIDEYLITINDDDTRSITTDLIYGSLGVLNTLKHKYRKDIDTPEIRIIDDRRIGAEASPWVIRINKGLIEHCLNAKFPPAQNIIGPQAPYVLGGNLVAQMSMAWILAHEWIHIIRCHNDVISKAGASPKILKALEHDADLCAAAEIYRALQRILAPSVNDIVIRQFTMYCLFWAIRTFPDNDSSETHSSIYYRLWHIYEKLIILQEKPSDPVDVNVRFPATRARIDPIRTTALKCEEYYLRYYTENGTASGNMAYEWLKYANSLGNVKMARDWEKISTLVEQFSNTRADSRGIKAKNKTQNKATMVKQTRKAQAKARATTRANRK